MKKIFTVLLAVSSLILVFWLLTHIQSTPTIEPYEVTQARTAAQVAEYDRQAWWGSFMQWSALIILALVALTIIVCVLLSFAHIKHRQRVELLRLQYDTSLLMPTVEGNYPALVVNRRAGEVVRIKPGNKSYPPAPAQFVIGNSPLAKIPTGRHDVPILINTQGQRLAAPARPQYTVLPVEPEQLEQPAPERSFDIELEFEANVQSSGSNVLEFSTILTQCKAAGEPKQASIEALTGVKKGGSKAWKAYSEFWDNLA